MRCADELGLGLVLADVGTQLILGAQAGAPPDALHDVLAAEPAHWAEIHQATGMLSVQLSRPRALTHDVCGDRAPVMADDAFIF